MFTLAMARSLISCLTLGEHFTLGLSFPIWKVRRLDLVTKGVCQLWNPLTSLLGSFSAQNPSVCLLVMQGNSVWMEPGP